MLKPHISSDIHQRFAKFSPRQRCSPSLRRHPGAIATLSLTLGHKPCSQVINALGQELWGFGGGVGYGGISAVWRCPAQLGLTEAEGGFVDGAAVGGELP